MIAGLRWLFLSRSGWLSIWLVAAIAALGTALFWHFERETIFKSSGDWWWFVGATSLALLPLMLLFLDSPDNYSKGPRPWLSVWTTAVVLALAGLATLDRSDGFGYLTGPDGLEVRIVFLSFLVAAFLPRLWNAINFAKFDADRRTQKAAEARDAYIRQQRARFPDVDPDLALRNSADQDAESIGALFVTLAVVLIGCLALNAGDGTRLSLESKFGFALCFGVIGVFVAVVCVDAFSELRLVRSLSRSFELLSKASRPLAVFYGWVDTGLVRLGAAMVGMGHQSAAMRYATLVGTMAGLALIGWYLPAPYGLLPAFLGFVLAISVSRLWNWVEEDRALAAMTEYSSLAPYRLEFREDYKDETLLAFAFVFLFAPIAMMQANDGGVFGPSLFENASNRHLSDWIGFFGIELAKAIPVVDWAEIYGVRTNSEMIAIHGAASRHSVFLARVMVDLVLIAALLQTVSIWTRSRQQKQLFSAGHIDRLDPFVERVEFRRALRSSRTSASMEFDLPRLGKDGLVDFRRYNEGRLLALYASSGDREQRAFIEAIANQRGMNLIHSIELAVELAEGNGDLLELATAFQRALNDHHEGVKSIEADDLFRILTALRTRRGLRSFKEQVVDLLESIASPNDVIEHLSGLAAGPNSDSYQYAREYMARAIKRAQAKL